MHRRLEGKLCDWPMNGAIPRCLVLLVQLVLFGDGTKTLDLGRQRSTAKWIAHVVFVEKVI